MLPVLAGTTMHRKGDQREYWLSACRFESKQIVKRKQGARAHENATTMMMMMMNLSVLREIPSRIRHIKRLEVVVHDDGYDVEEN